MKDDDTNHDDDNNAEPASQSNENRQNRAKGNTERESRQTQQTMDITETTIQNNGDVEPDATGRDKSSRVVVTVIATAVTTTTTSDAVAILSQNRDKGRYKKLHKRLKNVATHEHVSGFLSMDDYREWQDLVVVTTTTTTTTTTDTTTFCSSSASANPPQSQHFPGMDAQFYWRRGIPEGRRSEGSHHRDILLSLLLPPKPRATHTATTDCRNQNKMKNQQQQLQQQSSNNKKRSREQDLPQQHRFLALSSRDEVFRHFKPHIPAWLCLHNPVSIRHLGVIEIQVSTREQMESLKESLVQYLSSPSSSLEDKNVRNCIYRNHLVSPTRWFSGSINQGVKCITDALLFANPPPPSPSPKQAELKKKTCIQNTADLIQQMATLLLTREEMADSNYPEQKPSSSGDATRLDGALNSKDDNNNDDPTISGRLKVSVPPADQEIKHSDNQTWIVSTCLERKRKGGSGSGSGEQRKLWAIDCEMVETTKGSELARITMLEVVRYNPNEKHPETRIALDTLVQPENYVTDYLTQWSGVTEALLKQGPTMSLSQVHEFILFHVDENDIVVGHGLENDFRACYWIHSCCVDTAILFSRGASFKYSLRHLTRILLNRDIQQHNKSHCSEEDAKAALDLAVNRALQGPDFGPKNATQRSRNQWHAMTQNLKQSSNACAVAVGPSSWLQQYFVNPPNAAHALSCDDFTSPNAKALQSFVSARSTAASTRRAGLAWARFSVSNPAEQQLCVSLIQETLESVLPSDTVFLLALQCRYEEVAKESARRKTLRNPKTTMFWTTKDEEAFGKALEECRLGFSIWVGGQ